VWEWVLVVLLLVMRAVGVGGSDCGVDSGCEGEVLGEAFLVVRLGEVMGGRRHISMRGLMEM
jgi:hypothetical protein